MLVLAFDLRVEDAMRHHPISARAAYSDIKRALVACGFRWVQGSVYAHDSDDLAALFAAILALRELPWFGAAVRDLRGFRAELWSDFTILARSEAQ